MALENQKGEMSEEEQLNSYPREVRHLTLKRRKSNWMQGI